MTKFKVGDRVRLLEYYHGCNAGSEHVVLSIDDPEDGDKAIIKSDTLPFGAYAFRFEIADDADELATLRAFRKRALARYPDLAEPESDEDAARRLTAAQGYGVSLYGNEPDADTVEGIALAAIAWARANPRQD